MSETNPERLQPTPEEAYRQKYTEVCEELLKTANKIYGDRHTPGQPKDWADVGNLGHAIEVLKDLNEFLGA